MTERRRQVNKPQQDCKALAESWAELERQWRRCDAELAELGQRTRRYRVLGSWQAYGTVAERPASHCGSRRTRTARPDRSGHPPRRSRDAAPVPARSSRARSRPTPRVAVAFCD